MPLFQPHTLSLLLHARCSSFHAPRRLMTRCLRALWRKTLLVCTYSTRVKGSHSHHPSYGGVEPAAFHSSSHSFSGRFHSTSAGSRPSDRSDTFEQDCSSWLEGRPHIFRPLGVGDAHTLIRRRWRFWVGVEGTDWTVDYCQHVRIWHDVVSDRVRTLQSTVMER